MCPAGLASSLEIMDTSLSSSSSFESPKVESAGEQLSVEDRKRKFVESHKRAEWLSAPQKKRYRKFRQLRETRDELCRVRLEADDRLEAKDSEIRDIRARCEDKIEKHQSVVQQLQEDKKDKEAQIAQLTSKNLELKFQSDKYAQKDRDLSGDLVANFLKDAVSGQPLLEGSQTVCPSTVVKLCLSFLGCRRAMKY